MTENDDLKFIYDNDEEEKKPEEAVELADELGVEKYEGLVAEDVAAFDYFDEEKAPEMGTSGDTEKSEAPEEDDDDGERAFRNLVQYIEQADHDDTVEPGSGDNESRPEPFEETPTSGDEDDEPELNWADVDAELNSDMDDVDKALSSLLDEERPEDRLQTECKEENEEADVNDEDEDLRHFVDDILLGGDK